MERIPIDETIKGLGDTIVKDYSERVESNEYCEAVPILYAAILWLKEIEALQTRLEKLEGERDRYGRFHGELTHIIQGAARQRCDYCIFETEPCPDRGLNAECCFEYGDWRMNHMSNQSDFAALLDETTNKRTEKVEKGPPMTKAEVLNKAWEIVTKERQDQYGNCEDNFSLVAGLWGAYLGIEVTPVDVVIMMIQLKSARVKTGAGKDDNWIDIAGYAACGAECEKGGA